MPPVTSPITEAPLNSGGSMLPTPPPPVPVKPATGETAGATASVQEQETQSTEGRVTLRFIAPKAVKAEDQFTAEVQASDVSALVSAPFTLVYDPLFLKFLSASEGDFLKKDAKQTLFRVTNDATAGRVTVGLTQVGDSTGVSGGGKLLSAVFRAKKSGPASIGFMGVNFRASGGKPLEVIPYNSVIEVK
jgi:general secretion pathway protein D